MYLYQLSPTVRISPIEVSSVELIPGKNDLWQKILVTMNSGKEYSITPVDPLHAVAEFDALALSINNARYQAVWNTQVCQSVAEKSDEAKAKNIRTS